MSTLKFLLSTLITLGVIFSQVGAIQAAPPLQDKFPITGTVQNVVIEAGSEDHPPTVVISLLVRDETKIFRVDIETAIDIGVIVLGEDGNPKAVPSFFGTEIEVDPETALPDESSSTKEKQQPIGLKIAKFFSGFFKVDYELVMSSRSNGFGFGVISQALWMTEKLGGDSRLFQTILEAKKSNDYTGVVLSDGTMPQNWGQLRKVLLQGEVDEGLGDIVSGSSDQPVNSGNGKAEDHGNGNPANPATPAHANHGNGKPENAGNGKPDTTGNVNHPSGNGNTNRPETPPGQSKDKEKENNGKTKK